MDGNLSEVQCTWKGQLLAHTLLFKSSDQQVGITSSLLLLVVFCLLCIADYLLLIVCLLIGAYLFVLVYCVYC